MKIRHGNFFRSLWPSLILFQIYGLLPVETQKLEFSYKSIRTFYTAVFYFGGTFFLLYINDFVRVNFWYSYRCLINIQSLIIVAFHIKNVKHIASLIKFIDLYDREISNYVKIKDKYKTLRTSLFHIYVYSLIFIDLLTYKNSIYFHSKSSLSRFIFKILIFPLAYLHFLYVFMCFELQIRFKHLKVYFDGKSSRKSFSVFRLSEIRTFHLKLISASHLLNDAFGETMHLIVFFRCVNALVDVYVALYFPIMAQNERIAYIFASLSVIYAIVIVSDRLYSKAKNFKKTLFFIKESNKNMLKQVKIFSLQIKIMENDVKNGGIVNFKKSLFGSMTMLVLAYFIFLVSLSPQINRQLVKTFPHLIVNPKRGKPHKPHKPPKY